MVQVHLITAFSSDFTNLAFFVFGMLIRCTSSSLSSTSCNLLAILARQMPSQPCSFMSGWGSHLANGGQGV